jgi:hypothetical protein
VLRAAIPQGWQIIFNITFLLYIIKTKINATNYKMFLDQQSCGNNIFYVFQFQNLGFYRPL